MVITTAALDDIVREIEDPELPHVTIGDLGIVRSVDVDAQSNTATVVITPTYTGCPATEQIRDDVTAAIVAAGFEPIVRFAISPAWTTDWITDRGRERLRDRRDHSPAAGRRTGRHVRRPAGRLPAVLVATDPADLPVRVDGLQGELRVQRVHRTVRTVQGAVMEELDDTAVIDDAFTSLRVRDVEHDTDDSVVVTFDTSDIPFRHGQHLTLRREFDGTEIRRSYSICSRAPDGDLRVAIKKIAGGVFSTWANTDLAPGDHVDVMAPSGHFNHDLVDDVGRTYSLLAAGSGITPIFSIAATILGSEPHSRVSLLYVNRTSHSTMLLDELQDLRDRHLGRFTVAFAFTREETGGELLSGRPDRARLDELIESGFLPADVDHAFLCGPIDLIRDAEAALIDAGLEAGRVHREIFTTNQMGTVRVAPQEIDATSVAVATGRATLHGRATQFDLYAGDTVLDAVQRVRPDAPFSCRSGVCSTCQAVVRDGAVEMAVNYGLSDDEVARGYVLTCQSTPTTEFVDVDYDA